MTLIPADRYGVELPVIHDAPRPPRPAITQDVQSLAAALFDALGIKVPCGTVTLNMNESQVDSVETKTKMRVPKAVRAVRVKPLDSAARCG